MELDAHIGQLEGQVEERDNILGERNDEIAHLGQQLNALQVQLEDALDHIDMIEAQQEQADVMDVDADDKPEEMEGISGLDTISGVPMPPPQGAHSPVRSESSVNNLDDF